jgi:nicotinamide-nucleotide adenylyltransferase
MSVRALMLGRFQPLHNGHISVLEDILGREDLEGLIVAIGSAQESHTLENPFTAGERVEMLEKAAEDMGLDGLLIVPVVDLNRYGLYVEYIRSLVPPFGAVVTHSPLTRRLFQEKDFEILEPGLHKRSLYSGTEIRRRIIASESWQDLVPASVVRVLERIDGAERLRAIALRDHVPEGENGS